MKTGCSLLNRILVLGAVSVLVWLMLSVRGGCGQTWDGRMAMTVQSLIEEHAGLHDGALPASWQDLLERSGPKGAMDSDLQTIKQRMVVLNPPVPWGEERREILALHRVAFYERSLDGEIKGPGRYVIFREMPGPGGISRGWMAEAGTERVFAAARRELPVPGAKPEVRPAVKRALILQRTGAALYFLFCLWTFWPLIEAMRLRWMLSRWARTGLDPGSEPAGV